MIDMNWRLRAVHAGEIHRLRELQKRRESWGIHHNGLKHYDEIFNSVLPEGSLLSLLKPDSLVLDTFAPASFVRELNQRGAIQGGVAMTLTDTRLDKEKRTDEQYGIHQIESNFYTGEWYPVVNQYLGEKQKAGFDVIVCAPIGGWLGADDRGFTHAPGKEQIWWTTKTLWDLLEPGGNLFIAYVTHHNGDLERWFDEMKCVGIGVAVGENRQIARFTKKQGPAVPVPAFR